MDPLAPPGAVDDPADAALDLADPLGALALALMSRLQAPRAVAALWAGGALRVEAVKGRVGVAPGQALRDAADGLPAELAEAGLVLAVPLRHLGEPVGLVALGPRLGGAPYTSAEVGLARSLASATAASLVARRAADGLAAANRQLAARAHALRTLFEAAQAFGRALDRGAIADQLALTLMGQLMVPRVAVALCDDDDGPLDTVLVRGGPPGLAVPRRLARLDAPAEVDAALGDGALGDAWRWAVPLRAGDVTRGAVLLGPSAGAAPDLDFAAALAALAVGALETADRVEERVERERLREEVRLAREVQARLLPDALPEVPGLDVAARWRPSRDVSGDTYDAVALGGGRLLVAVADVVGKGIGAALLMATLQSGFRLVQPDLEAAGDLGAALAAATGRLDRLVAESTEAHQFVTMAWAAVDAGGAVHAVVAGHPPPRVRRADGTVDAVPVGGPLLGVLPGATFAPATAALGPGDALVLYTDGATEAQNEAGDELGPEGLDRVLAATSAEDAGGLAEAIEQAVDAWDAGADEPDDLTLVVVRRERPAGA